MVMMTMLDDHERHGFPFAYSPALNSCRQLFRLDRFVQHLQATHVLLSNCDNMIPSARSAYGLLLSNSQGDDDGMVG